MLYCPQCRQRIDPPAVSCAACGGIRGETLGGVPWEAPSSGESKLPAGSPVLDPLQSNASQSPMFTSADEQPIADETIVAAEVVDSPNELDLDFGREEKSRAASTCACCGSAKQIPHVQIVNKSDSSNGHLRVVVYGDPSALIFKDRHYEDLTANICGDCGHVELRVAHPRALYRHYLAAKK